MIGNIIEPTHLLLILVVALVVLGPKRLPEAGRSLGRGLRDFRQGMQGIESEARSVFSGVLDEHESEHSASTAVHATPSAQSPAAPTPHFVVTPSSDPVVKPSANSSAAATAVTATSDPVPEPDPADYAD